MSFPSHDPERWNGGGEYVGFNATTDEEIQVSSTGTGAANDVGSVVSSGTATGGSETTIIDSGATFVSDGVAVGDCVINDTKAAHGFVKSVDSETQLTIFRMTNTGIRQEENESGDNYRVVTSTGTGAAVIRIEQILDSEFNQIESIYAVMSGTTNVNTGVNAYRCTRAKVILAGSAGANVGTIRIRQRTTTANIFAQMPAGKGQTTIASYTAPIVTGKH